MRLKKHDFGLAYGEEHLAKMRCILASVKKNC